MTLEDKITADYKEAMKARDQLKVQVLSFLRSELKYSAIDKKKEKLEDSDVAQVLKKLIKQRQDSIEQFEKGARMDLVEKEKKELSMLKAYLPQELSRAEVSKIVDEAVAATGAQTLKDMGKAMKEAMARAEGRADGKLMSELIRKKLSGEPKENA